MKTSQLKMMIREVVREEIRLGLKEILGEMKTKPKQPSQQNVEVPLPNKNTEKHFSNNSILNSVLNETAMGDDWKTVMSDTSKVQQASITPKVDNNDPMSQLVNKDYRKILDAAKQKSNQKNGV